MITAEIMKPKKELDRLIKDHLSLQAIGEHKIKPLDTVEPLDWVAKGIINRSLKKIGQKTDAKLEELKNLKCFQSLVAKVKTDTRDKVDNLKSQLIFERDLEGNSPLELKEGKANFSPFGLNDSFHKLPNSGPGITPTQMTKSQKDNNSRSFDEVPSFNNPSKSHKSDIQTSKPTQNTDNKKSYTAINRSDMMNNPNLSFEDMKGKSSNHMINILDDSFGMRHQDIEVEQIPHLANDSFGAQDNMFQEVSSPPAQDMRILDPLLNSPLPSPKPHSQGIPDKASLSKTIMAGFTPSTPVLNEPTIQVNPRQSRMEDHDPLFDNPVFGSHVNQQPLASMASEENPGFSMSQAIDKKSNTSDHQASFGQLSNDASSSPVQQYGKLSFPEREQASITEEGTIF